METQRTAKRKETQKQTGERNNKQKDRTRTQWQWEGGGGKDLIIGDRFKHRECCTAEGNFPCTPNAETRCLARTGIDEAHFENLFFAALWGRDVSQALEDDGDT